MKQCNCVLSIMMYQCCLGLLALASIFHCWEWNERLNHTMWEVSFLLADSALTQSSTELNYITRPHLTLDITPESWGQQRLGQASWMLYGKTNWKTSVTGFLDTTSQTIYSSPEMNRDPVQTGAGSRQPESRQNVIKASSPTRAEKT